MGGKAGGSRLGLSSCISGIVQCVATAKIGGGSCGPLVINSMGLTGFILQDVSTTSWGKVSHGLLKAVMLKCGISLWGLEYRPEDLLLCFVCHVIKANT